MKKRPPKFSVKNYLASLQKPVHIADRRALRAEAAAITERVIKKAQKKPSDCWNFDSVTKEQIDAFLAFLERPRSELIMRARAETAVTFIIADLQHRHRRSKG